MISRTPPCSTRFRRPGAWKNEVLNVRRRMDEVLAHHTGKTVEQIHEDTERDYFLSAAEAQAYGIIDRVVDER